MKEVGNIIFTATIFLMASPNIGHAANAVEALRYFLSELKVDASLTPSERISKVEDFKKYEKQIEPEEISKLNELLLKETSSIISEILDESSLTSSEKISILADNATVTNNVKDVEIARQMLFFVAELRIHRQLVYNFGTVLGAPKEQLLNHDLSKLTSGQFEGYARFFRGGRKPEDKSMFDSAWKLHQTEEHHYEFYSREGFDCAKFDEKRLTNNVRESVADLLAATKQRGGTTLIEWLVGDFLKKKINPCLVHDLAGVLQMANELNKIGESNPEYHLFKGLPSWSSEVAAIFSKLKSSGEEN